MRQFTCFLFFCFLSVTVLYAQTDAEELKLSVSDTDNKDLQSFFYFEKIDYCKIAFSGGEKMKEKGYCIKAKEYKDGELVMDSIIMDSRSMMFGPYTTINDTIWTFAVMAKQIEKNRMKIMFNYSTYFFTSEFETIETEDNYSLRVLAKESDLPIRYDESFYLLAYILPYDLGNGNKSYCEVGRNGAEIEAWGTKFGVKHFFLFELKLE